MSDIQISVIDREGNTHPLSAPTDMNLNLMEVCRLYELPVQATCGGMAMCATCQVYVHSPHVLNEKGMDEEAMLWDAYQVQENSRLGCQIPIKPEMDGLVVELAPEE